MRLYKRGQIWWVAFDRVRRRSLKTRDEKEAQRIFKALEREHLAGRLIKLDRGANVTLGQFRDEYVNFREAEGLSPDTLRMDKMSLDFLVESVGAGLLLKLLNTRRIAEFKATRQARGAKPQSINSYLRHIKSALSTALDWGLIEKKPRIKMMPTDKTAPRYLYKAEIKTLLDKAAKENADLHRLLTFYLFTGCRRKEALRLNWRDIRFGKRPTVALQGKGRKTRTVPLAPQIVEILQPVRRDLGRVFPDWHPDTVSHKFGALAKACGIKARLHDLRHTAATHMIASGISIRTVQQILGHESWNTTQLYTHVIADRLHEELSNFSYDE